MALITLSTLGYVFGIDLLFWAWVIVTILAAIDFVIPDPLPFVDEAILTGGSIFLLILLGLRDTAKFFGNIKEIVMHPLALTFLITIVTLWIGYKLYKHSKKPKVKRK